MSNLITNKFIKIPDGMTKAVEFNLFCQWSALPRTVREPKEQKQLAEQLGVDEATLSIWKQHPEFAHNRSYLIKRWIGEDMPDIMHAVKKRALAHSTADAKLLLEWLDELRTGGVEVNVQNNTLNLDGENIEAAVKWYVRQNPDKVKLWLEESHE